MRRPGPAALRLAGLWALVCLPLLVGVVAVAGDHWHPTGDMAQAELHVRGFFAHPPLLGAAGRIGTIAQQGSHPGPAMWFALLPGYRLLGQSGWALEANVTIVAAAVVAGILVLARRRGRWPLAVVVALALAVLVRSDGPEVFLDPWNPWLPVLPFAAFVLLVWAVLCDDRAALPWMAGAGMFAVQCHVGYALLVGGLGAVAVAWAVRRRWWRPLAVAAAVTVVLWIPPLVEQLAATFGDGDWPGNLVILWRHFSSPDAPTVGVGAAVEAFAGELNLAGPWLVGRGRQPTDDPVWLGFVAMVAVWGAAVAVAWRRRLDPVLRLHATLAVACLLGLVSIARVFGDFFDYVVRWMWVLAALVGVAVAWTAWLAAPDRWRRGLATGAFVVLAGVVVAGSVGAADAESSGPTQSETVARLTPRIAARLDHDRRYLVRWSDTVAVDATGVGVLLDLERRGFDVVADERMRAAVLPHRVIDDPCGADELLDVVVGAQVADVRALPGAVEIASYDPRTPAERRQFRQIARSLNRDLRAAGARDLVPVVDHPLLLVATDPRAPAGTGERIARLIELGLPAHAFLAPVPGCDP